MITQCIFSVLSKDADTVLCIMLFCVCFFLFRARVNILVIKTSLNILTSKMSYRCLYLTGPELSWSCFCFFSSRDHSRILIGDGRGRVFSWSVSDQPGRSAADHWVKDEGGDSCSGCAVRFSLTERRHHCRNCGQLFCQK